MSIIERAVDKLDRRKSESEISSPQATLGAAPVTDMRGDGGTDGRKETSAVPATAASASIVPLNQTVSDGPLKHSFHASAPRQGNRVEIDLSHLHKLGVMCPDGTRSSISEEFRHIKRPLIDKAFRANPPIRHGNLIMVTSALPGEGKTYCAINLAMSIAMELDHTVLLVDADVARPSIPRFLGIDSNTGLMDLLVDDKLDLSQVMMNTNVDRLRILPSGKGHKRATELLASQTMSILLNEIASRYPDRIVIFDSPPVLLTSEARVLASQMGQIVMVVAAESTTQHAVKEAIDRIDSNPNISLVYNKAKDFPGTGYYGRYY